MRRIPVAMENHSAALLEERDKYYALLKDIIIAPWQLHKTAIARGELSAMVLPLEIEDPANTAARPWNAADSVRWYSREGANEYPFVDDVVRALSLSFRYSALA
jgi:hypothetical protein